MVISSCHRSLTVCCVLVRQGRTVDVCWQTRWSTCTEKTSIKMWSTILNKLCISLYLFAFCMVDLSQLPSSSIAIFEVSPYLFGFFNSDACEPATIFAPRWPLWQPRINGSVMTVLTFAVVVTEAQKRNIPKLAKLCVRIQTTSGLVNAFVPLIRRGHLAHPREPLATSTLRHP